MPRPDNRKSPQPPIAIGGSTPFQRQMERMENSPLVALALFVGLVALLADLLI